MGPTTSARAARLRPLLPLVFWSFAAPSALAAAQWTEVDGPEVGPAFAIAASELQPGRLFTHRTGPYQTSASFYGHATTVAASSNAGASWSTELMPLMFGFNQVVFDPAEPNVLWGAGDGVRRSDDGGRTWTELLASGGADRIAIDPLDSNQVYSVGYGLFRGSFHHSADGGSSWTSSDPFFLVALRDVVVLRQGTPGVVLVAADGGVRRSIDSGASFTTTLAASYVSSIESADGGSDVVWCITGASNASVGVARSLDGGLTWSLQSAPADDLVDIAAHATDPERAWVVSEALGVLRTGDGGQTWIAPGGALESAALNSIRAAPWDAETLFAAGSGGHGGVWTSTDGGVSWWPANSGLQSDVPELVFDGLGSVYALGLGLPVRRSVAAGPWRTLDYGGWFPSTAGSLSVHRGSTDTIAWLLQPKDWHKRNRIIVSQDGGESWSEATNPGSQLKYEARSLVYDAEGSLYAPGAFPGATKRMYRSHDDGLTWEKLRAPDIETLVPHPGDATVLHATRHDAYLRSLDRAESWTEGAPGLDGVEFLHDLCISRVDAGELALFGTPPGGTPTLFVSHDAGASWTAAGSGLPADSATRVAYDPLVPGRLLVGTLTEGVFLSTDHGASFVPWNVGLETAGVLAVAFDPSSPGSAWASTADGRLWRAALP